MSDKYDLLVLGGGPGGYVAALRGAQLGAKVALIEKEQLGGTCLNRGCIPTKALLACTNLFEKTKKSDSFGISITGAAIDWPKVVERKNNLVDKLVKGVGFLLEKNGVKVYSGSGQVVSPSLVKVGNEIIESKKIILATGSSPLPLPGAPFDGKKILSSNDLLSSPLPPAKLDIIGGGVIGIHCALIYSALGCEITLYEALPEILSGVDDEVVALVKRILKRKKITLLTNTTYEPAKSDNPALVCIGRQPNTDGLEALGLKMERRSVWVNEKMETSLPGIFAIGDLVSKKMLAHVASEQGVIAATKALGGHKTFSYDCVPYAIYTHPEIGGVGLTEKEAREKHGEIKVGKFPFAALGIAQAMGEIEGFAKVVSTPDGKILGIHIIGPEATTLIGAATLALKNNLTVEQLADTIQAHPTYPEGLQEAALAVNSQALHII